MTTQKIVDGGGKTYTSPITIQSNSLYQNYVFTGGGCFKMANQGITNVRFTNITYKNSTTIGLDINTWNDSAPRSSGIQVDNVTVIGFLGSAQYFFSFGNCDAVDFGYVSITGGTLDDSKDCGVIFFRNTGNGSKIHNVLANGFEGKLARIWGVGQTSVYDCIPINSLKYSAFELNGKPAGNLMPAFNVDFKNITGGNYPLTAAGVPTGLITTYDLQPNQTFSVTNTITFNTKRKNSSSPNIIDVESANSVPTNWKDYSDAAGLAAGNKYFPTMQAAGYANDAAVRLPDGRNWNDPAVVVPPIVIPPVLGPAKKIVTVQTVTDAAGNTLSNQTFTTNL